VAKKNKQQYTRRIVANILIDVNCLVVKDETQYMPKKSVKIERYTLQITASSALFGNGYLAPLASVAFPPTFWFFRNSSDLPAEEIFKSKDHKTIIYVIITINFKHQVPLYVLSPNKHE
jgi:hypothetical protein